MRNIYALFVAIPIVSLSASFGAAQEEVPAYDDPLWEENLAPFETFGISNPPVQLVFHTLGLVSDGKVIESNVQTLEGATETLSDPTGFGFTVGLSGDYLFDFDKASLKPKAQDALAGVLKLYDEYGGTEIQIEGHTDAKGADSYNQDLSVRRASSVSDWLANNGIAKTLLVSRGFGETKPVAKNSIGGKDNPEGRALNRRVEIKVTTTKKVSHLPLVKN